MSNYRPASYLESKDIHLTSLQKYNQHPKYLGTLYNWLSQEVRQAADTKVLQPHVSKCVMARTLLLLDLCRENKDV